MKFTLSIACGLIFATSAIAADKKPTAAQFAFFEKNVRPVLVANCYDCHGPDAAEGKLRVDSLAAMLKGGTRGPAIAPGKPEKSLLISAVNHGEILQMPPKDKLTVKQITDLSTWVQTGAAWPNAKPVMITKTEAAGPNFTKEEKAFWAFQPPKHAAIPAVKNTAWVRSPLDAFILTRLEQAGLQPAPPADKRTLIRRLTFDLTGLPTTPEDVRRFLADNRPDAYDRLVDRLLASPQYGEKWGRHWLDVARYADSNGMDENLAFANAFRYRDYVIAAFNKDKPYDLFVREQLAGDLLTPRAGETIAEREERLIATGYLSIGPKMLADDDMQKKEMDIIDEQIETFGRTFLGMTLGCARCHDHKFDPLRSSDYYSLAGIFKSTKTMENFRVVAVWHEYTLSGAEDPAALEIHQRKVNELERDLKPLTALKTRTADQENRFKALRKQRNQLEKSKPSAPRAMGVADGTVQDCRIHLRGSHTTLGREAPRQMLQIIAGEKQTPVDGKQSGRLQLARWMTQPSHPLTARVMVNRIWQWHFGTGIVGTASNFGKLGDRPTHPVLLDWMATEFVRLNWSVKAMHRLIVLSNTYRMSTAHDARAAAVDPKNRLHWRFDRRRMTAEEIRDSLLALGGSLDLTMTGQLMKDKNRAYVTGTGSKTSTYDFNRRSVYLPVLRSAVYQVLQAFDFADPSVTAGQRTTTTVTPQALFLMNGQLVADNTARMADRLLQSPKTDDAARIRTAFEAALGRSPTGVETSEFQAFIAAVESAQREDGRTEDDARRRAWQSFCRVLLGSNEFIYIE